MKILIASLLLFVGLNQALARSLPWLSHTLDVHDAWMDDDYDLFHLPSNQPNDEFYKFMVGDSSEESKEVEKSVERSHQGGFFGTLLGSFLDMDEEDTNSKESASNESNEKPKTNDDDGDDDDDSDETQKQLHVFLDEIFGINEEKSAEAVSNVVAPENSSSEESTASERKNSKSNEDSDEVPPVLEVDISDLTKSSEENQGDNEVEAKSLENSNEATEITDMAKSSPEQTSAEVGALSETDINKLASFIIALDILSDMGAVMQNHETENDIDRGKEADVILEVLGSVVDKMIEHQLTTKQINTHKTSDENSITTATNESVEEDGSDESTETTTTPKVASSASNNDDDDDDDDDKSNSSENGSNLVYVVFKGFGEQGEQNQQSLNEHKYSVINSHHELKPTSAPYMPETVSASPSTTRAQHSINEYVEIRENLDTEQDSLKKHELDLDKDFYAIVSNNFDDNTLDKFEKDIFAAQENLDNIKKNINAMQNLQTKLYFHKLVTTALKEAQNKPNNL